MPIGSTVHRLETVASTNDEARDLARRGAAHGTAVLAAGQTRGRGTRGKSWHSPAGLGLYASFILRGPAGGAVPLPHLVPLVAGLAAAEAIREAGGLEVRLKWPNDIVHGDRKLGGVLAEGAHGAAASGFAVVGIGLNIGHGPDDFPEALRATSTSIALAGGRPVTVETLFRALCRTLERWYNVLARGDSQAVVRRFESVTAIPPGAAVEVETADGAFAAEYRGLDAQGRLVVARPGSGALALDSVLRLVRTS